MRLRLALCNGGSIGKCVCLCSLSEWLIINMCSCERTTLLSPTHTDTDTQTLMISDTDLLVVPTPSSVG